jgi:hypothetical protein
MCLPAICQSIEKSGSENSRKDVNGDDLDQLSKWQVCIDGALDAV